MGPVSYWLSKVVSVIHAPSFIIIFEGKCLSDGSDSRSLFHSTKENMVAKVGEDEERGKERGREE